MQIKTTKDYYQQMYEKYPTVPKEDIKRILNYGWRVFYLTNSAGGDVCIRDNTFWCYVGYLKKNTLQFFEYYKKKLAIKLRLLFKRKKKEWDGYYYFARSEQQFQEYKAQQKPKGRKKRWFTFENVFIYKIFEECNVAEGMKPYIFRVKLDKNYGFRNYFKSINLHDVEIFIQREPLKFKDVLISNNEYEIL